MTVGLTIEQLEEMSIGYILDILMTKANLTARASNASKNPEPKVRMATQADMDAW